MRESIAPSGVSRRLTDAAAGSDEVDIHDLVFVEFSFNSATLYIVDAFLQALVAVDLLSGERTVVSGCTAVDLCLADEYNVEDSIALLHPQALDMNSPATRIVVVDDVLDALLAVDVAMGDRAVVSGCRVREVCGIEERGFGPSFIFSTDKDTACETETHRLW